MGLDLVEAQFRIAAGESLAAIGLADQKAVGQPRGFAIQARVVAQGTGTLTAYREPSGPGVRVDACGYLGLAPPPQFDPLLAKVIGQSGSSGTFDSAIDRTERALAEFHIAGLPTNIGAAARHPGPSRVPARRCPHDPALARRSSRRRASRPTLKFLDQQASALGRGRARQRVGPGPALAGPARPSGGREPACRRGRRHQGARRRHGEGRPDAVRRVGDEDGKLDRRALRRRDRERGADRGRQLGGRRTDPRRHQAVRRRRRPAPVVPRDETLDADAREGRSAAGDRARAARAGLARARRGAPAQPQQAHLPRAHRPAARPRQLPRGRQPGRLRQLRRRRRDRRLHAGQPRRRPGPHRGPSLHRLRRRLHLARRPCRRRDRRQESRYLDRLSIEIRTPSIRLLDGSSGGGSVATMVPKQGSRRREHRPRKAPARSRPASRAWWAAAARSCRAISAARYYAEQLATVPVVNMLLGSVVGIGAAKAVLGHFSVMVRDIAQLFVAGPPVVSHAMGYDVTKEDLGGWHIHCRNGSVDNLAETEEEAMAQTRRFLSLPAVERLRGAAGAGAQPTTGRPPRGGAAHPGAAQAHRDVRRAPRDPADRRHRQLLRDRAAVGHRPGHRLHPPRRPSGRRDRLRQPPRERRRADGGRLRQAQAPPRSLRPVPPAAAQPGRQSRLRGRHRARDRRHDPQGRRMDGRVRPGRRCRSSRC